MVGNGEEGQRLMFQDCILEKYRGNSTGAKYVLDTVTQALQ
jgi:hypothetical protein